MSSSTSSTPLKHSRRRRWTHAYPWGKEAETHPHTSVPEPSPKNEQAVQRGESAGSFYRQLAPGYGELREDRPPTLSFYDYKPHEPSIDELVAREGYETYIAGGAYGRPDLERRNYTTGHLMVYDPTPGQGGDFDDEVATRTWRKVHELAHAQTLRDINAKYGEGRRMGKLGWHRTLREAKRAVEWEWLTAHRQRDLSKQLGVGVSDEDFAREVNTVMHDAVHRAVTSKFTNPDEEGFHPSSTLVPLEHSLQQLEDYAYDVLGLPNEDALLTPEQKQQLKQAVRVPLYDDVTAELRETKDGAELVTDTGYAVPVPRESLAHIESDLRRTVPDDMAEGSGNEAVDAVIRGEGELLGKGDDGIVWRVGDQVVKMSTVVPYQPLNRGYRTPEEAEAMLRKATEMAAELADIEGVVVPEFISWQGKGFQVRPYYELPETWTDEEKQKVQRAVETMWDRGVGLRDDVQVGRGSAGPVLFDIGKAGPIRRSDHFLQDELGPEVSAFKRWLGGPYRPESQEVLRRQWRDYAKAAEGGIYFEVVEDSLDLDEVERVRALLDEDEGVVARLRSLKGERTAAKTDPLGEKELRRWFADDVSVTMLSARQTGASSSKAKREQHRELLKVLDSMGVEYRQTRGQWEAKEPARDAEVEAEEDKREVTAAKLSAAASDEVWYHITDNARFALDPDYAPEDNSIALQDRSGRKGIYLAHDPERWVNGHNYVRPFLAEFVVDASVRELLGVHGRWGGEIFVPAEHFDKLHLRRVLPLDAYVREAFGDYGWIETHHGTSFDSSTPIQRPGSSGWKPSQFKGYQYTGPDVREMSPEQIAQHKSRWRTFMKEDRGIDLDEDDANQVTAAKTDPLGERELRRWFAEPETVTMISARETGAPMSVVKRQQHRALLDDLHAMDGIDFRKTRGQWWDGETESMRGEPSFVIRGLTFDQALGLARKYNQEGFIFKNVDGAALMYENYRDVDLEAGRKPTAMPALRGGKPLFGPEAVEVKPLKKIKTLDEEKTEKQRRDDAAKGRQEKRKPDPAQEPNLFVHSRSISFELPFDFTDKRRLMPWDGSGPVSRTEVESYYEPPAGQEAPPPAPTPAEPPAAEPGASDPDPRVGAQGSVRAGAVDAAARRSAAAEGRLVALRSVGYQRYEGRLPDGAVVRVGAEDRVDHGSYPAGRRQRRRRVWVVRVGGEVFGEAATLAAARDLVETAAGQHRVAQNMQMPAKDAALHEILRDANIPYPPDFTAADNAYRRWKNQYARFRPPRPIYSGGELDAPNIALSLEGDRRLSGLLHAWERLTEGVRRWDDPRLERALDVLSEVPGLESIRLPEWVLAAKAEAAYWQDLARYAAHESVGVFLRLSDELVEQWPVDERVGTPHFTLLHAGKLPDEQKAAFFEVVEDVLASTEPVTVELSPGVEFFESFSGETIAHKGVTGEAEAWMRDLHARLRGALADAGIEVEARDFIPHATLAYLDEEEWDGAVPEGRFDVSELEVWGFDGEVPVRLGWTSEHKVARRRKKRTDSERRRRVYRPTWYIREGSQVAWNAAFGVSGLREVTLAPGARVLQVGEHMLRTASKTDLDLAKLVEQQSATIERLSRIVEQLMARNSGYDAIQTEDRLIVLNPKALEEQPPRKRWLKADADRVHEPAPEPAVA